MTEQQINVQQAAEAAGAQYLVRVSGGRAVVGPDVESVVGRGHHAIEESLKKSKLKWTILRPGLFMQNVLGAAASVKTDGKMRVLYPIPADQRAALTDVRDTAALGARILIDPAKHAGKSYEFTGSPRRTRSCERAGRGTGKQEPCAEDAGGIGSHHAQP